MTTSAFDEYLKRRGVATKALARQAGVSAPTIRKWRRGSTYPQIDNARAVAEALGLTLDELADLIVGEPSTGDPPRL